MKDQFIEQNGLLFLKCEPVPLEQYSNYPCLTQYSKRGRIGRLNKELCANDDMVIYYNPPFAPDYLRYDIIAKHCPEGSVEWALWQMLNGKKVCNHSYHGGVPLKISDSSVQKWARNAFEYNCEIVSFMRYFKEYQTGWKIYEEPKPEVDKWYWNKAHNEYCYAIKHYDDLIEMRCPGTLSTYFFDLMEVDDLVEAFLDPDFSNAKVGDECYSSAGGACRIIRIDRNDKPEITVNCSGRNGYYHVNGKYATIDIHPTLFHSAAQCAAYFAEVALKERGGE